MSKCDCNHPDYKEGTGVFWSTCPVCFGYKQYLIPKYISVGQIQRTVEVLQQRELEAYELLFRI